MGILNSLTATAEVAYSLRKLLTAYAGFVITIRRSGDDLEGDVAFDGDTITMSSLVTPTSGDPTPVTLSSFSSGLNCYISKWYSQIGTYHSVQITNDEQVKIIDSVTGLLIDSNNLPRIFFDGLDDWFLTTATTWTQPNTINTVSKYDATGTFQKLFDGATNRNMAQDNSGVFSMYAGSTETVSTTTTDLKIRTFLFDDANSKYFEDGSQIGTTYPAGSSSLTNISIGGTATGSQVFCGYFYEFIMFNSDIGTTDRELLEADQDTYYINPPSGITIDHTAGTLNMPVTTHTVTAIEAVPINIEHSAGTLNMPSTTHTVTATENVNIAHVTGTLNMPTTTHTITAGASTSINHVAGTFNMPSVTHTVTIASVVTGLTADIKSILTRINPTIYRNDKPDTVDNLMVIYQTGGQPALHSMGVQPPSLEKPTFQVLIRNTSHDTAELQATQVKNILDGLTKLTINNTRYEVIFLEGDIIHLGRDDRERTQFTLNFVAWIKRTIVDTSTWLLNSDTQPFTGFNYVWDDTAVWDDTNIWKD